MFERFTERARQVVVFAQDEARAFGHDHIGTEHLLLGLIREEEGIAARALRDAGLTLESARAALERIAGRGNAPETGQMPFTPRAKRTLELSLREAIGLQHGHVGTEHILLALVSSDDGIARRVLDAHGVAPEQLRAMVLGSLGGEQAERPTSMTGGLRFEHRLERIPDDDAITVGWLNELGSDGWELGGVLSRGSSSIAILKRLRRG